MVSTISPKELEHLSQFKIGMLGYGAQGSAEAKNLRKSGVSFRLGLRDGESKLRAQSEGFEVFSMEECLEDSDLVFMNLPDQTQAGVYRDLIRKNQKLKYLVFAHGFSHYFKYIPIESDGPAHILIAPKGAASGLESLYGTENALPCILAYEDSNANTPPEDLKLKIESLARAVGSHPKALYWASFADECVCDLFSEQALLCGGVSSLLRRSFEVLVEAGFNPETAYFETLFELKLIVDLIWQNGISGMRAKISPTARFGDVTRGDRIIDERVKTRMKEVLAEIQRGDFAEEFLKDFDGPKYKERLNTQAQHPIEAIGQGIRQKMKTT